MIVLFVQFNIVTAIVYIMYNNVSVHYGQSVSHIAIITGHGVIYITLLVLRTLTSTYGDPQLLCFWICRLELLSSISLRPSFVIWTFPPSTENPS